MTSKPTGIGIIGCGVISEIYLKNLTKWPDVHVVAVADQLEDRARLRAEQFGVAAASVADLLADPGIEIVLNLTVPAAHAEVGLAALNAGKSVYNEKPLTIAREDGQRMLDLAREKGLLMGAAPDTFLGAGLQNCRRLIDQGVIGDPVAASLCFVSHGPETWHPQPEFYYLKGGGPLFDMGPYYLTALVTLLGGVKHATGVASVSSPTRKVGPLDNPGRSMPVETPTHIAGALEMRNGAIATIVTSFDVWGSDLPRIELYGTKGVLSAPDPNTFGGAAKLLRAGEKEWTEIQPELPFGENSRGLGVRDMARALRDGGPSQTDGALAYHVLDVMHGILDSARDSRRVEIASIYDRPTPFTAFAGTD
jgi:predicted dehydrogenase